MYQMKIRLLFVAALAWLLVSCGFSSIPDPPFPTRSILVESATETLTLDPTKTPPTPSLSPTLAKPIFTITAPPVPSITQVKVDLDKATLHLEELPKGFQVLDEKSQAQAGLAPNALTQSFAGIFRQAQPIHSFAYVTSDPKNFEIVVGLVFSPILAAEQASFDQILTDPNGAIKNFAKSFGSDVNVLPNLPNLGDSRTGWGFTSTSGQPQLKGEMVITRRETVICLLVSMFPADQKPTVKITDLAQILDANVNKAFGK